MAISMFLPSIFAKLDLANISVARAMNISDRFKSDRFRQFITEYATQHREGRVLMAAYAINNPREFLQINQAMLDAKKARNVEELWRLSEIFTQRMIEQNPQLALTLEQLNPTSPEMQRRVDEFMNADRELRRAQTQDEQRQARDRFEQTLDQAREQLDREPARPAHPTIVLIDVGNDEDDNANNTVDSKDNNKG